MERDECSPIVMRKKLTFVLKSTSKRDEPLSLKAPGKGGALQLTLKRDEPKHVGFMCSALETVVCCCCREAVADGERLHFLPAPFVALFSTQLLASPLPIATTKQQQTCDLEPQISKVLVSCRAMSCCWPSSSLFECWCLAFGAKSGVVAAIQVGGSRARSQPEPITTAAAATIIICDSPSQLKTAARLSI